MLELSIKPTRLDELLRNLEAEPKEIYFETSIGIAKISSLRNSKLNLYVFDFYLMCLSLDQDINKMAEILFLEYKDEIEKIIKARNSTEKTEKYGKFGKTIEKYLNTQNSLSDLIKMDPHKFGRLLYSDSDLIAVDLYVVTKLFQLDFKLFVENICSHLKLNSPEEQARLRAAYQATLATAKVKRDKEK